MTLREILFRAGRSASTQIERVFASRKRTPKPCLSHLPTFPIPLPDIEPGPLVNKALKVVDGCIDVLAIQDFYIGAEPQWNRDPKSGLLAKQEFGKTFDYRDETIAGNIKYLWEPSRHLMMPVLAQAFRTTGDRRFLDRMIQLLDSWFAQCRFPNGPHWCSSLESGIRLINWSMAWRFVGGLDSWRAAGATDAFLERWMESIYRHLHFVDSYYSSFSSANNHLIGEAAGVYIGASTWPAWPDSAKLRIRSRVILIDQAAKQTHLDGVNAEQAIAYQQFVLDFFLLSGLAANDANDPFPESHWDNIERMLEFVAAIMDVKGNVPMIGDADDGYVVDLAATDSFSNFRSLLATGAIVFGRADFAKKAGAIDDKTRWLIPNADAKFAALLPNDCHHPSTRRAFPDGGYFVLGSDLDTDREVRIVVDAGTLGFGALAAHGHADALSFTLSVSGVPIIIDPGTYSYHTEKLWRNYFRGTSAHNTVRVDQVNQSEIGGNFLWNKHAMTNVYGQDVSSDIQYLDASHDGYARLDDPVVHRRVFTYDSQSRLLTIQDRLECEGEHEIEQFFHFAEYVEVQRQRDMVRVLTRNQSINVIPDQKTSTQLVSGDEVLPLGWVSYRFDSKIPTTTLRTRMRIRGATVLETTVAIV